MTRAFLKVSAPGQRAATIIGSFSFRACSNDRVLGVDALHPGAGIPGVTRN